MRIGSLVLVVWLVIGVAAAFQRDYLPDLSDDCASVATTAVTVVAGPLNYVGVDPKVTECETPDVPQPSE